MTVALAATGCAQSIFVGMPTPVPEQQILSPLGEAPVPDFGPRGFASYFTTSTPAPNLADIVNYAAGPAFAWSETENILLLGTDRREYDSSWRTDTIMIMGLDREKNRIAVLSIPRDLYVNIPGYGYGRINQADFIGENITRVDGGGPALISDILNDTFGIETEHWVRFEMSGFESIVDAVGGVTVHLDCPFFEPILNLDTGQWEYFTLPAGDVHMDGETAYWYARLRLKENDIGRSNRQRQLLWALRNQMLSKNLLLQIPQLWQAFNGSFSTDLSLLQMIELGVYGMSVDPSNVRASGITLKELQSFITDKGASVLIISEPAKVQAIVDGVWDAPPMVNAYSKDADKCEPIPTGPPVLPVSIFSPTVTADTDTPPSIPVDGEATSEADSTTGG